MTKTKWGFVLVAGLVLAFVGIAGASSVGTGTPAEDFANDVKQYAFGAVSLLGVVAFFTGAVKFSRGEK